MSASIKGARYTLPFAVSGFLIVIDRFYPGECDGLTESVDCLSFFGTVGGTLRQSYGSETVLECLIIAIKRRKLEQFEVKSLIDLFVRNVVNRLCIG